MDHYYGQTGGNNRSGVSHACKFASSNELDQRAFKPMPLLCAAICRDTRVLLQVSNSSSPGGDSAVASRLANAVCDVIRDSLPAVTATRAFHVSRDGELLPSCPTRCRSRLPVAQVWVLCACDLRASIFLHLGSRSSCVCVCVNPGQWQEHTAAVAARKVARLEKRAEEDEAAAAKRLAFELCQGVCRCGLTPCPQAKLKRCDICGDIKSQVCRKAACLAARAPLLLTTQPQPEPPLQLTMQEQPSAAVVLPLCAARALQGA